MCVSLNIPYYTLFSLYISFDLSSWYTQLTLKLFNDGVLTSDLMYVETERALTGGDNLEVAAIGGRGLKHYPWMCLQTPWKITRRLARIVSNSADI